MMIDDAARARRASAAAMSACSCVMKYGNTYRQMVVRAPRCYAQPMTRPRAEARRRVRYVLTIESRTHAAMIHYQHADDDFAGVAMRVPMLCYG